MVSVASNTSTAYTFNDYGVWRTERRTGLRPEVAETRARGVAALMRDSGMSNLEAQIHYDFNIAPKTTNAKQLEEIGCTYPLKSMDYDAAKDEVERLPLFYVRGMICDLIDALADLNIYLLNTDGLSDADLLVLLWLKVLQDTVPDMPCNGATEFVDLAQRCPEAGVKVVDRDRFLPKPSGQQAH
jgi:hypothetical protein